MRAHWKTQSLLSPSRWRITRKSLLRNSSYRQFIRNSRGTTLHLQSIPKAGSFGGFSLACSLLSFVKPWCVSSLHEVSYLPNWSRIGLLIVLLEFYSHILFRVGPSSLLLFLKSHPNLTPWTTWAGMARPICSLPVASSSCWASSMPNSLSGQYFFQAR